MSTESITLALSLTVPTAVTPSPRVMRVAAMFGLGLDEERQRTLVPPVSLTLRPGQVIFITGASGGGKTTLLRLIAEGLLSHPAVRVIRFDALPALADVPLVEAWPELTLEEVASVLSLAGLNDAFVMLRSPSELSDGQRYRLRLAQALALTRSEPGAMTVVLADEFGATLDRLTAKVIARNLRRWTRREAGVCLIVATTHDDLLESLEPDVLIEKGAGSAMTVLERETARAGEAR